MEYINKDLFLGDSKVRVIVIWVRTLVNDAIHVKVQVVEIWDLKIKSITHM